MKTLKTFIVLLLSLTSIIVTVNGFCSDVLIGESSQTYQCNSPGVFSNSSLTKMPVGTKVLAVTGELKIDSYCPSATSPYRFTVVTLDHPTIPGTKIKLFDIYWDVSLKRLSFSTEDSTGVTLASYTVADTLPSASFWYSFTAYVDLSGNVARAYFGLPGRVTESSTSFNNKNYSSTWSLKTMNPTLYLCSDENGGNSIGCEVSNLKVFYAVPLAYWQLREGSFNTLFARYNMNQTSGWTITDSVGYLGPALFGSSTETVQDPVTEHLPSWVPSVDSNTSMNSRHVGIRFSNASQYVTIPTFPIAMAFKSPAYSITFKFWIYYDEPPTSDRWIFRFSNADLSRDYMGLKLDSYNYLVYTYANRSTRVIPSRQLAKKWWNAVSVSYAYRDYAFDGTKNYGFISSQVNVENDLALNFNPTEQISDLMDPTNVIRIGGPPTFIGMINGFEIYNPGSIFTAGDGCSLGIPAPGSCVRDVGLSDPAQCLIPKCHSTCGSCVDATETGCLSCALNHVLYQGKCVPTECGWGKYFNVSDYSCNNCLSGCAACTGPTIADCPTCRTGFWKVSSGLCECVTGNYLPENATTCATCASKTTNCYQCTQNGTCTRCYNGYLLIRGECVLTSTCPARMYKGLYECFDCPSNCAVCNSLGCQTCDPGFFYLNKQCYTTCPDGSWQYNSSTCSFCSTSNCASCPYNSCQQCKPGYLLSYMGCASSCPTGYYSNGTNCLSCSTVATNCNQCNSTSCLTCKTNYLRYNGQCVTSCPAGTTQNGTECL